MISLDREDRWDKYMHERLSRERENFKEVNPLTVIFADMIKETEKPTLLDLGCGLGKHMHYLNDLGFKVIGCDISEETLYKAEEMARESHRHFDFIRGDYVDLPFNSSVFDGVLCIGTLYHDYPEIIHRAFREIRRVLSVKGLFCFDLMSEKDCRFGKGRALGEKLYLQHRIPHYFFSMDDVRKLLDRMGFAPVYLKTYNFCVKTEKGEERGEKFHIVAEKLPDLKRIIPPFQKPLL